MRVLITTPAQHGHLYPLVPLARALVAAGHDVRVACAPSFAPIVAACGLTPYPAGFDLAGQSWGTVFPAFGTMPAGLERSMWAFDHVFVGAWSRAFVPAILDLAATWRPDVLVRDYMEFGACIAGELLDIPHAVAGVCVSWPIVFWEAAQPALEQLRADYGLPPDPENVMPWRYLGLPGFPPSWPAADESLPPTAHLLRPEPFSGPGASSLPGWIDDLPAGRPLVHVSLGTLHYRTPGGYEVILTALRDEPLNLVVAVGSDQDPAAFGLQPPSVRIERYVAHTALLPRCDLFVTHGGFGSCMAGLTYGVPMVATPIAADQPYNAQRLVALGVAQAIAPSERTPEAIVAAVRTVLRKPSYRAMAAQWRDLIAAMPGSERGVELLEQLAQERTAITTTSTDDV